jgi:hypothetical protein
MLRPKRLVHDQWSLPRSVGLDLSLLMYRPNMDFLGMPVSMSHW